MSVTSDKTTLLPNTTVCDSDPHNLPNSLKAFSEVCLDRRDFDFVVAWASSEYTDTQGESSLWHLAEIHVTRQSDGVEVGSGINITTDPDVIPCPSPTIFDETGALRADSQHGYQWGPFTGDVWYYILDVEE